MLHVPWTAAVPEGDSDWGEGTAGQQDGFGKQAKYHVLYDIGLAMPGQIKL